MERIERYLDRLCLELKAPPAETAELRAELKAHLDEKVQGYLSQGLSEDESIEKTLADFGNARAVGGELTRGTRRDFRRLVLRRLLQVASVALFFGCLLAFLHWRGTLADQWPRYPDELSFYGRMALVGTLMVVAGLSLELPRLVFRDERRPRSFDYVTAFIYGLPGLIMLLSPVWLGLSIGWVHDQHLGNDSPVFKALMWLGWRPGLHLTGGFLLGLALAGGFRSSVGLPFRRLLQLAGVSLFLLCFYYYWEIFRRLGPRWDFPEYQEAILTVVAAQLLVLGVLALDLPRWVQLIRDRNRVLGFDTTTFLVYAVPGLTLLMLPLISYHIQGPDLFQQVIGWLSIHCYVDNGCYAGALVMGLGITAALRNWKQPNLPESEPGSHQTQTSIPAG